MATRKQKVLCLCTLAVLEASNRGVYPVEASGNGGVRPVYAWGRP